MKICEIIKKGLHNKNISQADLAREMHLGRGTVNKWVTGENIPPGDKLIKIANYLDIVCDLFPDHTTNKSEKALKKLKDASLDKRYHRELHKLVMKLAKEIAEIKEYLWDEKE